MKTKIYPEQCQKTKIILIISIFFFGIFGLAKISQAATLYVCPSGCQYSTIQAAANVVNPGDTVIVRNGIYTTTGNYIANFSRSGNASNYITYKCETPPNMATNTWYCTMDGRNYATTSAFRLSGSASYIRFEDFEFRYFSSEAIYNGSGNTNSYIYFYRNHLHHISNHEDCNLWCCSGTCTCGNPAIYQSPEGNHWTWDSGLMHHIGRTPSTSCPEFNYNHDQGFYGKGPYNTVINSVFYEMKAGWPVAFADGSDNWKVINNTFVGANSGRDGQILVDEISTGNIIENNISYNSGNYFIRDPSPSNDDVTIRNNIVYGAQLVDNSGCNYYTCANNYVGSSYDPKFANLANHDFHLQSTSPAINKGLAYSGRTVDADGKSIVGLPDIGAYEYGGGTDTTAPAIPTGVKAN